MIAERIVPAETAEVSGSGCAFGAPGRRPLVWRVAAMTVLLMTARATWAQQPDVPFVPTPQVVVDAMLELAGVGPRDYIIDLGSGDGRIVIAAARKRGARGLGVEIDVALVGQARLDARRQGVGDRVDFRRDDLLQADIGRATVVTLYLYPRLMKQMRPRLIAELRPGTRIVSHEFDMDPWQPDTRVTVAVPDKPYGAPSSEILLWIVPADASGLWRWRLATGGAAADYELDLSQSFQVLNGKPVVAGGAGRFEGGRMRGEEISFALSAAVSGRALRHEFSGRLKGDEITGIVKLEGIGERAWNATRVRRGKLEQQ